jgi:flagellar biosynthesis protein FlhG
MDEFSLQGYIANRKRRGKIIAVSGGKGGTGKTNMSVNLSIALAQCLQRVVLMDADIGLANAEVIMGLKSKETLRLVIEGRKHVSEVLSQGPAGIHVVPGVSGLNHLADLNSDGRRNVRLAMEELQSQFDFVIIDTMAGIGPSSVAFAVAADEVLLVTTPEPSALLDGYAMVKMISTLNPRAFVSVLVNIADNEQQAFSAMNNIGAASRKFLGMQLNYAGHVPRDPNVNRSVLESKPFVLAHPWSPASKAVKSLAISFLEDAPVAQETGPHYGFFRRFANTLGIAQ